MPVQTAILMTVGTSLIDNVRKANERRGSPLTKQSDEQIARNLGQHWGNGFPNFQLDLGTYWDDLESMRHNSGFPSAEIQSFCFWLHAQPDDTQVSKVILLPTDTIESKRCAEEIKAILQQIFGVVAEKVEHRCSIKIDPFRVDPSDEEQFAQHIADFMRKVHDLLDALDNAFSRKVLNITGGYKVLAPVFALYGFQREDVEVIYQHETSKLVVQVPALPMAWDFRTLDEYRSLVRRDHITDLPPPRFRAFFRPENGSWTQNTFGQLLAEVYERDRLRRFGYGARLIHRWLPKEFHTPLERRIPRWEHIWIGDQIPETVEHSRGHSQRLMEYAAELLEPQNFLSERELYCLICCLWLHDIGHTGLAFRLPDESIRMEEGENSRLGKFKGFLRSCGLRDSSLVQASQSNALPRSIRVAPFPSLVRLFHNFLSAQRICDRTYDYLPENECDAVALISMYDRGKMPLTPKQEWWKAGEVFGLVAPPLQVVIPKDGLLFGSNKLAKDRMLLLAALLRIIDGLDIQSDRTLGSDYWAERKHRTREEVAYYLEILRERCQQLGTSSDNLQQLLEEATTSYAQWQATLDAESDERLTAASQLATHIDEVIDAQLVPQLMAILLDTTEPPEHRAVLLDIYSLANRLLFKMMQEAHFRKHSYVKLVHVTCVETNSAQRTYKIYMTFAPDIQLSPQQKAEIAEEIWKEVKPAEEILQQSGIVFNGIFDWQTQEQLQPEQRGTS